MRYFNFSNFAFLVATGIILSGLSQPGTAAGPDRVTVKRNCRRLLNLHEMDRSREALNEVNRLLQQSPGELEYLRCRMHIYCDLDNPEAAIKDGESLLKANPRDTSANFTLGNLYTARREYNKARVAFNKCLEEDPHWAEIYSWKSRIDYEEGKFESALSNASQALKYDPNMGSAWTNQAMALCELHQLDKAMVSMKHAIALKGATPKMRNNLALILLGLERYQEALAELNIVIKQSPQMMLAYLNRSSVNNALKRPKEALDDLNHAIALGGDKFPYLFTNRACVYSEIGKYREAIADCEKALVLNKKFPKAYEVIGYAYYRLHDYKKGIEFSTKAIDLSRNFPLAYKTRGLCYGALGDQERSRADLEKSVTIKHNADAYRQLGQLSASQGYFEQALDDLAAAGPDKEGGQPGEAAGKKGPADYRKMLAIYDKMLKANPGHSETYFDRGLTLMVAGNLSAACSDFQTYQRMLAWSGPNALQASVWQYLCLHRLGRSADGRLLLQEAINKAPALAKAPEIAYLRGRLSAQNLIGVNPSKAELTFRCTLIGLELVNAGKSSEALSYLQRVKTQGESRMDEYALALAEIEKITRATPATSGK